jgi:periplasmic protein TonB
MESSSDMNIKKLSILLSLISCLAVAPSFGAADAATQFDKAPMPVRTPPPSFPDALKGTSGIVSLIVVVNEDGSVASASVAKSTDAGFEAASLEAIAKWKFKPAEINGQPVKSKITVPIRFSS